MPSTLTYARVVSRFAPIAAALLLVTVGCGPGGLACGSTEGAVLDYASDSEGADSAEGALALFIDGYPTLGPPAVVVRSEDVGADRAVWTLAANESSPISAVVSAERAGDVWHVVGYERCTGTDQEE